MKWKPIKQAMSAHREKCDKSDLMCNKHKKKEGILTPSYSIMHVLEDCF